jgi:hypothetical protein
VVDYLREGQVLWVSRGNTENCGTRILHTSLWEASPPGLEAHERESKNELLGKYNLGVPK